MPSSQLKEKTAGWVNWMKQHSLPRWGAEGINPENAAAYEQFLFSGAVDSSAPMRMRVQARQMYTFSMASALGWMDSVEAKRIVDGIAGFSMRYGQHPSGEGFVHILAADYTIADSKRDLYDHAFFLLSCAARYKAFKDEAALALAEQIITFVDREFGQVGGGWLEGDYDTDRRRQNPHMHMFEALLSLHNATGNGKWLARAGEIFGLFETRFFDAKFGVLREFFDHSWTLLEHPDADIIEPGHLMEWVWLLRWYERVSGHNTSVYADTLYEKALTDGFADDGLLMDGVSPTGEVIKGTKRSWPMTELVKASLVQAQAGYVGAEDIALEALNRLEEAYISREHLGLYVDQLDEHSLVIGDTAQASILYHLLVAVMVAEAHCA